MTRSSNIRVSVQFQQPAVFAGEDVECIITFTNHADTQSTRDERPPPSTRRISDAALRKPQLPRHKQLQHSNRPHRAGSVPSTPTSPHNDGGAGSERKGTHGRSLSILSMNAEETGANENSRDGNDGSKGRRPASRRSRAASVQSLPHRPRKDSNGMEHNVVVNCLIHSNSCCRRSFQKLYFSATWDSFNCVS
jgi:hypothetical protein